jgi:hypothetical protein
MFKLPETGQMFIKPSLYQGDKQGKFVFLNCNSKKTYISAMERVFNYGINHQKHQIVIGLSSTKHVDSYPILKHKI